MHVIFWCGQVKATSEPHRNIVAGLKLAVLEKLSYYCAEAIHHKGINKINQNSYTVM